MKRIILFLLLIACGAFADSDTPDELGKLEAALNSVLREQQSVYQSYQMTKELRLMEVQEGSAFMMQHPYGTSIDSPPPNYDDVVRRQMESEQRIQQHTVELKRLLARYMELEHQGQTLRKQIRKLKLAQHPGNP